MQNFCLSDSIFERLQSVEKEVGIATRVEKVDCSELDIWQYLDENVCHRDEIDELGLAIKEQGQYLPVIVVKASDDFMPKNNPDAKYVVLSGVKRWLACKQLNMAVLVLEREMSFNQAMRLFMLENNKQHLSDYARGMFYASLLRNDKIDEESLKQQLSISQASLNNYLAFAQVPESVWKAVGDLSCVSANTAQVLKRLLHKGKEYQRAILTIADHIAKGVGAQRIKDLVESELTHKNKITEVKKNPQFTLTHKGKVLMQSSGTHIKLAESLLNNEQYQELIDEFSKVMVKFCDNQVK